MNIAAHVVLSTVPQPVAVFSVEMSKESLFSRMVCCEASVDSAKFRDGYLNSDERRRLQKAANRLSAAPLFIRDGSATLTAIYNKSRKLQQEHGLGLVVVDYLQLMTGKGKAERRDLEVGAMSRGLKLMAGELRVPVLALSQVSRAPEARTGNHRPQLSDLRESGNLEQDADNVAFIFRPEMYNRDREDLRGVAEVILDKQRNGATGVAHLVWLREYTKFENRASDLAEPQADMFSAANQHLYTDVG
jgi:replicative DNA helicase